MQQFSKSKPDQQHQYHWRTCQNRPGSGPIEPETMEIGAQKSTFSQALKVILLHAKFENHWYSGSLCVCEGNVKKDDIVHKKHHPNCLR